MRRPPVTTIMPPAAGITMTKAPLMVPAALMVPAVKTAVSEGFDVIR